MPIMKKKSYENFTIVDNYFVDDINCKPECMGYLLYMLRKPQNWEFSFKSIMKDLGVGERNVRTNIQKLEALKYIKRERSTEDKRVVYVTLTEKGRKAFFHHRDFHKEMIKAAVRGLDEDEMKALISCLDKLDRFFASQHDL